MSSGSHKPSFRAFAVNCLRFKRSEGPLGVLITIFVFASSNCGRRKFCSVVGACSSCSC